ncbi:MAG TPA: GNAT family protein [Saprospiraceae bacterium]|nr:GNAT family protein [Saprospiraceae bacterium]HPI06428.1 GNAT family protein [Saprospiraceae bacterium]
MSSIFSFSDIQGCMETGRIRLYPLEESHFENLLDIGQEPRIWMHYPVDLSKTDRHLQHLKEIWRQVQSGVCHAFTIVDIHKKCPVGMTRLFNFQAQHRQGETGSWLSPAYWGTHANREAKFLLLRFCFEELHLLRVQFRTDVRNTRSRRSLEKLGAQMEGIVRKERVLEDGSIRDAALYSILDTEWPEVKAALARDLITLEGVDLHPPFMGSTESSYSPLNAA